MDLEDLLVKQSIRTKDWKVNTLVKKYEDIKDLLERRRL